MNANQYDNSDRFHDKDWRLRQAISQAIDKDERIPIADRQAITITVVNGMVMLSGKVKEVTSKMLAYGDALQVDGIADVLDVIGFQRSRP